MQTCNSKYVPVVRGEDFLTGSHPTCRRLAEHFAFTPKLRERVGEGVFEGAVTLAIGEDGKPHGCILPRQPERAHIDEAMEKARAAKQRMVVITFGLPARVAGIRFDRPDDPAVSFAVMPLTPQEVGGSRPLVAAVQERWRVQQHIEFLRGAREEVEELFMEADPAPVTPFERSVRTGGRLVGGRVLPARAEVSADDCEFGPTARPESIRDLGERAQGLRATTDAGLAPAERWETVPTRRQAKQTGKRHVVWTGSQGKVVS